MHTASLHGVHWLGWKQYIHHILSPVVHPVRKLNCWLNNWWLSFIHFLYLNGDTATIRTAEIEHEFWAEHTLFKTYKLLTLPHVQFQQFHFDFFPFEFQQCLDSFNNRNCLGSIAFVVVGIFMLWNVHTVHFLDDL